MATNKEYKEKVEEKYGKPLSDIGEITFGLVRIREK
jgi:hypothetical protein